MVMTVPWAACCHGFIRSTSVKRRLHPPSRVVQEVIKLVVLAPILGSWSCSLRNATVMQ